MKNYLVTGGAGFIGYWLTKTLSENRANHVFVVDNFVKTTDKSSFDILCARENISFLDIDLSFDDLDQRLPNIEFEIIYHLAALNGTQNFYNIPFDVIYNSTLSTLRLLKWCEKHKPGRFVYASTSEAYSGGVSMGVTAVPTSERVPLIIEDVTNPRWSYASSKLNGESAVISAQEQFGIDFTILRYHNVYGPRMGVNHVIPDYLNRAKDGIFKLYGGDNTRSFIYVDDAVLDTINLSLNEKARNEIVNIGSSEEMSMLELGLCLNSVLGVNEIILVEDAPNGSVSRRVPCLLKISEILGERERVSLDDGLIRTVEYYAF